MVVQHNLQAQNAQRMYGQTTDIGQKYVEKLNSGYKVNRSADDAAGLSISEKMRFQIRGLDKSSENASHGISLIQTAESALGEVHDLLHRMKELSVQAANDTNCSQDRSQLQLEINQLTSEIDRISSTTQFNTMNLLDGSLGKKESDGGGLNLQIGALSGQGINITIESMDSHSIGINDLDLSSFESSGDANARIDKAIDLVSIERANLGSVQNRIEHTVKNIENTSENTSASESRVRDTNMAKQVMLTSTNSIISQSGQTVLAQANQASQGALTIL